jgi:hypothetical protein
MVYSKRADDDYQQKGGGDNALFMDGVFKG